MKNQPTYNHPHNHEFVGSFTIGERQDDVYVFFQEGLGCSIVVRHSDKEWDYGSMLMSCMLRDLKFYKEHTNNNLCKGLYLGFQEWIKKHNKTILLQDFVFHMEGLRKSRFWISDEGCKKELEASIRVEKLIKYIVDPEFNDENYVNKQKV